MEKHTAGLQGLVWETRNSRKHPPSSVYLFSCSFCSCGLIYTIKNIWNIFMRFQEETKCAQRFLTVQVAFHAVFETKVIHNIGCMLWYLWPIPVIPPSALRKGTVSLLSRRLLIEHLWHPLAYAECLKFRFLFTFISFHSSQKINILRFTYSVYW